MGLAPFSLTFYGFFVVSMLLKGAASCQTDWTYYKGYCYGLFNNQMTWANAEIDCHRKSAQLASFHSMEEMVHVAQYIMKFVHGRGDIWIGMSIPENDKRLQWVDNTPTDYLPWDDREPNNFFKSEGCVELLGKKDYIRWNDEKCSRRQGYICKHVQ